MYKWIMKYRPNIQVYGIKLYPKAVIKCMYIKMQECSDTVII